MAHSVSSSSSSSPGSASNWSRETLAEAFVERSAMRLCRGDRLTSNRPHATVRCATVANRALSTRELLSAASSPTGPSHLDAPTITSSTGSTVAGWEDACAVALVQQGWGAALGYPALILDPEGRAIEVQIFESPDLPSHWPRLDDFEGPGYQRVAVPVETADGCLEASIYATSLDPASAAVPIP